jgi:hypothetical protein
MTTMTRLIFALLTAMAITPAMADCSAECDAAYEECKAATSSPNGEKVCGSDYHECKTQCAESGE